MYTYVPFLCLIVLLFTPHVPYIVRRCSFVSTVIHASSSESAISSCTASRRLRASVITHTSASHRYSEGSEEEEGEEGGGGGGLGSAQGRPQASQVHPSQLPWPVGAGACVGVGLDGLGTSDEMHLFYCFFKFTGASNGRNDGMSVISVTYSTCLVYMTHTHTHTHTHPHTPGLHVSLHLQGGGGRGQLGRGEPGVVGEVAQ